MPSNVTPAELELVDRLAKLAALAPLGSLTGQVRPSLAAPKPGMVSGLAAPQTSTTPQLKAQVSPQDLSTQPLSNPLTGQLGESTVNRVAQSTTQQPMQRPSLLPRPKALPQPLKPPSLKAMPKTAQMPGMLPKRAYTLLKGYRGADTLSGGLEGLLNTLRGHSHTGGREDGVKTGGSEVVGGGGGNTPPGGVQSAHLALSILTTVGLSALRGMGKLADSPLSPAPGESPLKPDSPKPLAPPAPSPLAPQAKPAPVPGGEAKPPVASPPAPPKPPVAPAATPAPNPWRQPAPEVEPPAATPKVDAQPQSPTAGDPKPNPQPAIGGFKVTVGPDGKNVYTPTPAAPRTIMQAGRDAYGRTVWNKTIEDPATGATTRISGDPNASATAGTDKGQPEWKPTIQVGTPQTPEQMAALQKQYPNAQIKAPTPEEYAAQQRQWAEQRKLEEDQKKYQAAGAQMDTYAEQVQKWQAENKRYEAELAAAKSLADPRSFNTRIHAPGNRPSDVGRNIANFAWRNTGGLLSANMDPTIVDKPPQKDTELDADGLRKDQRDYLVSKGFTAGRPQMPGALKEVYMPGVTGPIDPSRRGNEYNTAEAFTPEQQKEFGGFLAASEHHGRLKPLGPGADGKARYQLPEELGGGEYAWDGPGAGPKDHHDLARGVMRRYAQGYGWQNTQATGAIDAVQSAASPFELFLPGAGLQTLVRAGGGKLLAGRMTGGRAAPTAATRAAPAAGAAAKAEGSAVAAAPKPVGAAPASAVDDVAGGVAKPVTPAPAAPAAGAAPARTPIPTRADVAGSAASGATPAAAATTTADMARSVGSGLLTPTYGLQQALGKITIGGRNVGALFDNKVVSTLMAPIRAATGEGGLRNVLQAFGAAPKTAPGLLERGIQYFGKPFGMGANTAARTAAGARAGAFGVGGSLLPFLGSAAGGHNEGNARIANRQQFLEENKFSTDPKVLAEMETAQKEIEAIRAQPGFVRTGDPKSVLFSNSLPGLYLPTQIGTTLHDLLNPNNKMRNPNSPTVVDDVKNRLRGAGAVAGTAARAPEDELAAHRLKDTATRVLPNTLGDVKRQFLGMFGEAKDDDAELKKVVDQLPGIRAAVEAAPPNSPERLAAEQALARAQAEVQRLRPNATTVGTGGVNAYMQTQDQLADAQKKLEQLKATPGADPNAIAQLEKDVQFATQKLQDTPLTARDQAAVESRRKSIELARKALADPNVGQVAKLDAQRTLKNFGINPDAPDVATAGVGSWQKPDKGTTEFDPATGQFKTKPPDAQTPGAPPAPFGAAGPIWGDADEQALASTVENAALTGDFASAKKGYEDYVQKVGGDPRKIPLAMVPDVTHEHFPGMDPAKFGAMIDGDKPGLYDAYTKGQQELAALQKQIEAAGPNVPPALKATYDAKYNQMQQQRTEVQGRALTHYQQKVIDPMIKTEIPAFNQQVQAIQAKIKSGQPLSPQEVAQAQQLQGQGREITDTFTRFAMKQATVSGARTIDGQPIATVADFVKEAGNEKSPIGAQVKASIDRDLLDLIPGRKGVDEYGRPVTESLVDPDLGKSIFAKMDGTSKMLMYAGLGLGAIGMLGGMMGFGGPLMPILGMLGLGVGAYGATGGQMSKLLDKGFWGDMMGGLKGTDPKAVERQTLEQIGSQVGADGRPVAGTVSLTSLQQHPTYQQLLEGKMPATQSIQTIAMLRPADREALKAQAANAPGGGGVARMVDQVNAFEGERQQRAAAQAETNKALSLPPEQNPAARANNLSEFYAHFGIKGGPDQINAELQKRLPSYSDQQLTQMIGLMPPGVKSEAVAGLEAKVQAAGGWSRVRAGATNPLASMKATPEEIAQAKQAMRLGRALGIPAAR